MIYSMFTDLSDSGLNVTVSGNASNSSSVNEIGIGLDLGFLSDNPLAQQVAFLFKLALEGADGALLSAGRTAGQM